MDSIIDYLEHWAGVQPDKPFSSFLDSLGNEKESYTYLGFHERSRRVAGYLSEVGLKRGDRALLVYTPGLEIIVAFFACARIGVIPVPVYPPTRANFEASLQKLILVVRDCQPTVALTTAEFYQSYRLRLDERHVFIILPRQSRTDKTRLGDNGRCERKSVRQLL